jgi:alpha/beta superfamily hydrolase
MPDSPQEITCPSPRGSVRAIFHPPAEGKPVVLMVGGFDGGFDGPADAIFPTLAEDIGERGIGTLRIDFIDRFSPGIVRNGAADVKAGIEELKQRGVQRFGLVGHSFGAAVMISVAVDTPEVETVVSLSAQTAGAQRVSEVAPRPILFIHGLDDIRLPPDCSRMLYSMSGEPKELILLEGARHSLRQSREQVRELVRDWLLEKLGGE